MKHPLAKKWDEDHGAPEDPFDGYIEWLQKVTGTTHRPCDWCGKPLGKEHVTIHLECIQWERKNFLKQLN